MEQIERIGVSLEKELLADFDKLIAKKGYQNRSEAIRDLIRQQLSSRQLGNPKTKATIFDEGGKPKPAYFSLLGILKERWRSR